MPNWEGGSGTGYEGGGGVSGYDGDSGRADDWAGINRDIGVPQSPGIIDSIVGGVGGFFNSLGDGLSELFGDGGPITATGEELINTLRSNPELWNMEGIPPQEGIPDYVMEAIKENPDEYTNMILGMNPYSLPEKFLSSIGGSIGGGAAVNLLDPKTIQAAMSYLGLGELLGQEGIKGLGITGGITARREAPDILRELGFSDPEGLIDEYVMENYPDYDLGDNVDRGDNGGGGMDIGIGTIPGDEGDGSISNFGGSFTGSGFEGFEGFGGQKQGMGITGAPSNIYQSMIKDDESDDLLKKLKELSVPTDMLVNQFSL